MKISNPENAFVQIQKCCRNMTLYIATVPNFCLWSNRLHWRYFPFFACRHENYLFDCSNRQFHVGFLNVKLSQMTKFFVCFILNSQSSIQRWPKWRRKSRHRCYHHFLTLVSACLAFVCTSGCTEYVWFIVCQLLPIFILLSYFPESPPTKDTYHGNESCNDRFDLCNQFDIFNWKSRSFVYFSVDWVNIKNTYFDDTRKKKQSS